MPEVLCTCSGCNQCDTSGDRPCSRGATEESDQRCRACHDRAAEMWAQTLGPEVAGPGYGLAGLLDHWRKRRAAVAGLQVFASDTMSVGDADVASAQIISPAGIPSEEAVGTPQVYPEILVQAAIVVFGDKTNEGQLIQGVTIPWFEIIKEIQRDSQFLFQVPWRRMEELIAGAYERAGWPEVILTQSSGDRGRDVIATKPGIGSIRILDQVKAYSSGYRVSAGDVRALLGVLALDSNVSKGIITTTSSFAPGIFQEAARYIPYRLELRDGERLREWLIGLME